MRRVIYLFLLGTLIFGICFQFTPLGFLLSSLAGIVGMILFRYLFKGVDRLRDRRKASSAPAELAVSEVVRDGMQKLRQMSNTTRMITNNDVAGKIREICRVGVRIFEDIEKNPDDLKRAKQFVYYYMDATKKIIDQYVELSRKRDITPDVEKTLLKIEEMLGTVKETFDRQLANLLENDLLDLNAEITLLKKTMKLEG